MTKKSDTPAIRFKGFTDTWEQRKAKELFVSTADKGYPELPVLSATQDRGMIRRDENSINIFHDKKNEAGYKRVLPGQFVIHLRSFQGGFAHSTIEGITSPAYTVFGFSEPEKHDSEYWKYVFTSKSFIRRLETVTYGIRDGRSISYEEFLTLGFVYPSKAEQKAIARYLDKLSDLITLHQRKYDKLTNVKKSMLEKMFPKNGSNVPEIRFKGFTEAWEQRKVREVADRYDNLRIPVAANLRIPGSTPYYGANGIQDYVDGYTHEGEFILVAEDGANDLKNYPVKCVKGRIWVNNHAHVLQGKNEIADNKFLAFAISQADIESLLVGGSRAKLNAETLMEIDLLLPEKQEQVSIGNYLTNLDHLITLHQRELEKLKNIKKSCLENMFV